MGHGAPFYYFFKSGVWGRAEDQQEVVEEWPTIQEQPAAALRWLGRYSDLNGSRRTLLLLFQIRGLGQSRRPARSSGRVADHPGATGRGTSVAWALCVNLSCSSCN